MATNNLKYRISSGNELNAALLRLVEYLGYPHNLVVGVTLMEVGDYLKQYSDMTDNRSLA